MRVIIIPSGNNVTIDGEMFLVDLAPLREQGIHAVQFYGEWGEIEYKSQYLPEESRHHCEPNKVISDVSEFQSYIDAWQECKDRSEEKKRMMEAEMKKMVEDQNKALQPKPRRK
ncbi:MAG TPA: hypothetical protein VH593_10460 [Ktedonobacteraceae bacterium]|jgi:hypothetical protein